MRTLVCNADIGGTNARMQLWEIQDEEAKSAPRLVHDQRYQSRSFDGIEGLVTTFLRDCPLAADEKVAAVCLAICGPVDAAERKSTGPVLPEQGPTGWGADVAVLERLPNIQSACLINDFVAVGLGLTAVASEDIVSVHQATNGASPGEKGCIGAVGAGTGLGAVFLTWDASAGHYTAHASEGGMAEFSAHSEEQWALRQWLVARDGFATVEGVVSGPGLVNIYQFLAGEEGLLSGVAKEEQAAVVVQRALREMQPDALCLRALDLFITCLACHLRQTALHLLPTGGLYIAGGIAPKILPRLKQLLPELFIKDPVMGQFIAESFPLYIVLNDDCGLLGARIRAERLVRSHSWSSLPPLKKRK